MTSDSHPSPPADPRDGEPYDELQDLVADVLNTSDPVPPHLIEMARGAFAWRSIDADLDALAELVFDSALDSTGVRDASTARQLTFATDQVEIEVMVDDGRLIGQLVPPVPATIQLEAAAASIDDQAVRRVPVDRLGSFVFADAPTGPVRLRVVPLADGEAAEAVVTAWTVF